MRLLHIITSLRTGGAERLVTDLMPRFRSAGIDVELALLDGTPTQFLERIRLSGIPIHSLGMGLRGIYSPLHIARIRPLMKRFDIVHTHNYAAQLFGALAASPRPPLMVTTEHNTSNRRSAWRWWKHVDRHMYARYDAVACCSRDTHLALTESMGNSIPPARLHTIPNGIDLTPFLSLPPATPSDIFTIVMVAAFRPQKDHITPLRALASLPDNIHLIYAGDGPCRNQAETEARRLGLGNRVSFLGEVSDIPALYAHADASLLSTRYEGLSLTTVEAMASGRPLIASDVPGVTENVSDGAILFPSGDPASLASAITRLISSPDLSMHISRKGRTTAARYDIGRTAQLYISLYSDLINNL